MLLKKSVYILDPQYHWKFITIAKNLSTFKNVNINYILCQCVYNRDSNKLGEKYNLNLIKIMAFISLRGNLFNVNRLMIKFLGFIISFRVTLTMLSQYRYHLELQHGQTMYTNSYMIFIVIISISLLA